MPAGIYRDSGFGMSAPVPDESGLPFASHGVDARNFPPPFTATTEAGTGAPLPQSTARAFL